MAPAPPAVDQPVGPGPPGVPDRPPSTRWSWRRSGTYLLEAIGLCGLAFTQPVLDLLSHTPELFLFRGATPADIVVLLFAVAVVPALVVWIAGTSLSLLVPTRATVVRASSLGPVAAALALVWLKEATPLTGPLVLVAAAAAGVTFAVAYVRVPAVGTWTRLVAIATPVFLYLALAHSPLTPLVRTGDVDVADLDADRAPPVVFVTLDELPTSSMLAGDGTIDASMYPNLAGLAADATWYRNFSTVSTTTVYAVPSMLTGRYPTDGTSPTATDHPDSLFTWLGGTYDVHAAETWTRLCPTSVCDDDVRRASPDLLARDAIRSWWDLASPTDEVADPVGALIETAPVDDVGGDGDDVPADLIEADVDAFVAGLEPRDAPTLHYLHALSPHQPWRFYPSGVQYTDEVETFGRPFVDQWVDQEWPVTLGRQRHLLQASYTDALLGRILDQLRETDLYERSLVVVTADHGIGFEAGELSRGDGPDEPEATWSDLIGVPLLVKAPGQTEGEVVDDNVQSIDLLPTMADLLDLDLPFEVDGTSALAHQGRSTPGVGTEPGNDLGADGDAEPDGGTKRYFQARVDWDARRTVAGETREVDADEALRRTLARGLDTYRPERSDPLDLYRVGPAAHLIGLRVDSLPVGDPSALGIDDVAQVVDPPAGGRVAGLVTGSVDGAGADEATLVVAVDGVVAAAGTPFPHLDRDRVFAVLLPEPLLGPEPGELTYYELDGDELRPVVIGEGPPG